MDVAGLGARGNLTKEDVVLSLPVVNVVDTGNATQATLTNVSKSTVHLPTFKNSPPLYARSATVSIPKLNVLALVQHALAPCAVAEVTAALERCAKTKMELQNAEAMAVTAFVGSTHGGAARSVVMSKGGIISGERYLYRAVPPELVSRLLSMRRSGEEFQEKLARRHRSLGAAGAVPAVESARLEGLKAGTNADVPVLLPSGAALMYRYATSEGWTTASDFWRATAKHVSGHGGDVNLCTFELVVALHATSHKPCSNLTPALLSFFLGFLITCHPSV
jgi:hypothetical protein